MNFSSWLRAVLPKGESRRPLCPQKRPFESTEHDLPFGVPRGGHGEIALCGASTPRGKGFQTETGVQGPRTAAPVPSMRLGWLTSGLPSRIRCRRQIRRKLQQGLARAVALLDRGAPRLAVGWIPNPDDDG